VEIRLREIDRSTWEECCCLQVSPEQREFVASNAFSLAQAAYEPDCHPMEIFYQDRMVGFLMWDFDSQIEAWEMCRLMIDEQFQGRGFGSAAVKRLLSLVRNKLGPITFHTSVDPANTKAIVFYEKLGFRKNERIVYDEIMLEIKL